MPEAEYEYYGMMAQTWDLFRGDTSGSEDRKISDCNGCFL